MSMSPRELSWECRKWSPLKFHSINQSQLNMEKTHQIPHYASKNISASCGRSSISTNEMSSSVATASRGRDASVPTWESPNSAMTASCIRLEATRKLPMEMVGNPPAVLALGCAFLSWRSRWKRQIKITDKLRIFSWRPHAWFQLTCSVQVREHFEWSAKVPVGEERRK